MKNPAHSMARGKALVKIRRGGPVYMLEIPKGVSSAIGRRGPVPIVATLATRDEIAEVQASLVPMGGGRHRLQLNVALLVPEEPPTLPLPSELALALMEADLQASFSGLPVGKQNHIILWIEEAVRPETREKRMAKAIEVAFHARECAYDRRR
jgi:hypothetical protein